MEQQLNEQVAELSQQVDQAQMNLIDAEAKMNAQQSKEDALARKIAVGIKWGKRALITGGVIAATAYVVKVLKDQDKTVSDVIEETVGE